MRLGPSAVVALCSAAFFLSYFSRLIWSVVDAYSTLYPTVAQSGLIFSLFFVGYIIIQIPAGVISDRVPPNIVSGLALVGLAIMLFISGSAASIDAEYIASISMGLCAGWIYPSTLKTITSLFPRREKQTVVIGYYSLAWPLTIIVLGIAIPPIVLALGWRWGYYILVPICLAIGLLLLFSGASGFKPRSIAFSFLVNRNTLLIASGGFLFFFAYWAVTLFAYDYFLRIGLGDYAAGVALSSMALAGIPSTLVSGYVINKMGLKRTSVLSILVFAGMLFLLSGVSTFLAVVLVSLAMGFFRFLMTPTNSDILATVGGEGAGTLAGFSNLFWQLSGVVAPVVSANLIGNLGYRQTLYVLGFVALVSSILYSIISLRTSVHQPQVKQSSQCA